MTFLDDVHCRLAVGDNGRRAMDESDLAHPLGTEDWRQISQTMTKLGLCLNAIRLGCIQCTVQTFLASALNNDIYYYYVA